MSLESVPLGSRSVHRRPTCHLCVQEAFTWLPSESLFTLTVMYSFSCTFGKIYAAHEPHILQTVLLKTKLDLSLSSFRSI